jgi:CheY-like chemotaxis protein
MPYHNILLIDDDEDDQEIFLTALGAVSGSIVCTTISSAREALQKLTGKMVTADLIFLDLNMPIMNGQQFLTEIKKNDALKDIPVIVFSTSSHSGMARDAKDLGAHDFITKPDKFNDLVNILRSVIR